MGVGTGVGGGVGLGVAPFCTVNIAVRTDRTEGVEEEKTTAVTLCDPSITVFVSQGNAFPFDAVPRNKYITIKFNI